MNDTLRQIRLVTLATLSFALLFSSSVRERKLAQTPDKERLVSIAADFRSWETSAVRAGEHAPMPTPNSGARPRWSAAAEGSAATHAGMLYHLHARDRAAYLGLESGASQWDQVLVMETFLPREYVQRGPGRMPSNVISTPRGARMPGRPAGLFVMFRAQADPVADAPGAESAWRYGVVSPDGAVAESGRIARCIACHERAPYGGAFGLDHR